MTTKEIISAITSRDTHLVWQSSCEICSLAQDREKIVPLIPYLPEIKSKTKGLNMGGGFAPNQRFIDYAIRVIEFHRDYNECPCKLYAGHEMIDPKKEEEKGFVKIRDTVLLEGNWIDYYKVECTRCGHLHKVIERDYHYTWWGWSEWDQ
jgi:hypothetical protein